MSFSARLVLIASVLAGSLGCIDDAVPAGVTLTCTDDTDCPDGFLCRTQIGVCVEKSSLKDSVPPTASDVAVTPELAKANEDIVITFRASETLFTIPDVELAFPDRARPAVVLVDGENVSAKYHTRGDEPEGDVAINARLVDLAGNVAEHVPLGNATLDFTPPSIVAVTSSPTLAKDGVDVSVRVQTSEALDTSSTAVALVEANGTRPLSFVAVDPNDPLVSIFHVTTDASADSEGSRSVSVVAVDPAGNATNKTVDDVLLLDFTAPAITPHPSATPQAKTPGATAVVTFDANEELAGEDVVLVDAAGNEEPLGSIEQTGLTYVVTRPITASDADGTYEVRLKTWSDAAGNVGGVGATGGNDAAIVLDTIVVDGTAPTFSTSPSTDLTHLSRVAGHDHLTLTFALDEPAAVSARLGGRVLACTNDGATTPPITFTCPYAVADTDVDGAADVVVTATDAAGNSAFASAAPVIFDFTPPALAAATVSPALAKGGDVVVVSVAANEVLAADPALVVSGPGGASPAFTQTGNTFAHPVIATGAGADLEGTYATSVTLVDLAGNTATLAGPGFALDLSPPEVTSLTISPSTASAQQGFNVVDVDVVLSEALTPDAPNVIVTVAGVETPCVAGADPLHLTCSYAVQGNETEGAGAVAVALRDDAGNTGFGGGTVTFDFTAPSVVDGSVALTLAPAATNVLGASALTAVTTGTTVNVSFTLSEPTATRAVSTTTPSTLAFAPVSSAGTTFLFARTLAAGDGAAGGGSDGAYTVAVTATDLVGNTATSTLALPAPGMVVDTTPPSPPSTGVPDAITYTRAPFGSDATGGAEAFTIAADNAAAFDQDTHTTIAVDASGLEIARAAVDTSGAVPTTTIALTGGDRADVFVRAVDGAGNESAATRVRDVVWVGAYGGKIAGSQIENPHIFERHTFSPDGLQSFDAIPAGAQDGIATSGGAHVSDVGAPTFLKAGGLDSPLARRQPAFAYDSARHRTVLFGGDASKTDTWEWDGLQWQQILQSDPEGDGQPAPRDGERLVYDPIREKTILVGGILSFPSGNDETWEWNGASWAKRCNGNPVGDNCRTPPARVDFGMVFDQRRGVVVLFGGANDLNLTTSLNDTWEWDGNNWTQRCVGANDNCGALPPPRIGEALAYNDVTGHIMMFGGVSTSGALFSDTWEYDGTTWTDITTPGPSGRQGAEMQFDPQLGEVVLFGGGTGNPRTGNGTLFSDVFAHDGTSWHPIAVTDPEADGSPAARSYMGMATTDNEIELYGGGANGTCDGTSGACQGVWRWNGNTSSWSDRIPDPNGDGGPVLRNRPVLVFDSQRKKTIMFGGQDTGIGSNADNCRGERNNSFTATTCGFTWEWNGVRWTKTAGIVPGSTPDPRVDFAMAYDRVRGVVVLFGGQEDPGLGGVSCEGSGSGFCPGTWEYNPATATWTKKAPTTNPTPRKNHAMAFDEVRNTVVMFGGITNGNVACDGLTDCSTLWSWNGTNWTPLAQGNIGDGVPLARERFGMSWDDNLKEIVLFGGLRDFLPPPQNCNEGFFGICDDTWSWNGTRWKKRATKGPGSTSTGPTREFTMAFDRQRKRTIFVDGRDNNGGQPSLANEFDGVSWSQRSFADPEADGSPPGRIQPGAAFDELDNVLVTFGSESDDKSTWLYDSGSGTRSAGHHMIFSFGTAGAEASASTTTMVSLTTNIIAGADGGIGAAPTAGANLLAWDGGRWRVIASNTASSASPAALPFITTDPLFLRRIFSGADREVRLAVRSDGNAQVSSLSRVTTDLAEISIHYRLP